MTVRLAARGTAKKESLDQLVAQIGDPLPSNYSEFLMRTNGGKPEENRTTDVRGRGSFGVRSFFGFTGKNQSDLLLQHEQYRVRVPSSCVPIADDDSGNRFCLACSGDLAGTVWFWDHELEADEGEVATFANMKQIANSFGSFFQSLNKFDASKVHLDPKDIKSVWISPKMAKIIEEQNRRKKEKGQ